MTMTQPKLSQSQQVLLALQEASQKLEKLQKRIDEPIAIIGMGCRLPGAENLAAFWTLLRAGVDAITEIPADRWAVDEYYDPNPDALGKMYTRAGGFIAQGVDQFDPQFFGLSPREVTSMDPQHRLLLEVTWEALEDAGLPPDQLWLSKTGVFMGLCSDDYAQLHAHQRPEVLGPHFGTGTLHSFAVGRIGYLLGLQGPNVQLNTACSSSLVGIHLACQSLRAQEADLALAGGVHLILSPQSTIGRCGMHALSPDGRCKTFDASADGYGQGEGCGVVVLKRLSDAQAAGDTILAVIRGSAVNHDGPSSGLTVPNEGAQARVIQAALKQAKIRPDEVSYLDAHGTGTSLGDPIEINAIGAVFGKREVPLIVGSVKSNIGHLEAAAGVVSLIKVVLALHHETIPPHLHLHTPNPHIDWANLPIQIPQQALPWPAASDPRAPGRVAGVSSFGMSGTNAHLIVAEAPVTESPVVEPVVTSGRAPQVLTFSAKTAAALHAYAQRYHDFLATADERDLADLCYTSHIGRSHYAHRLSLTATSVAAMQQQLTSYLATQESTGLSQGMVDPRQPPPKIAFLFTGQGAQAVNMGRELYATSPLFRTILERCDELLRDELTPSLLSVLYPEIRDTRHEIRDWGQETGATEGALIDQTQFTQPALFALEVALAAVWQSWGIEPDLLIGHSIGELAAACVAGVFSLEDGLKLVAARGRLMGALPQTGAMIALAASEERVRQAIEPYRQVVSIAAVNGPESVVISGERDAVLAIAAQLAATGVKTRQLTVSHAFHSPLMAPMLGAFRQVAQTITYHQPNLDLVSNLTGKLAGAEVATPDYWVRHVRDTVRFADGIATLRAAGITAFLEIGPKPVLLGMVGQFQDKVTRWQGHERVLSTRGDKVTASPPHLVTLSPPHPLMLPSLRDGHADWQQLLESLGALYGQGVKIDWHAFDRDGDGPSARRKVSLPTYPFQRQRYWIEDDVRQPDADEPTALAGWLANVDVAALSQQIMAKTAVVTDTPQLVAQVLTTLQENHQAQINAQAVANYLYEVTWRPQAYATPSLPLPAGRWLIFADQGGVGAALAQRLHAAGHAVTLLYHTAPAVAVTLNTDDHSLTTQVLAVTDLDAFQQQLQALLSPPATAWGGFVHLWALDSGAPAAQTLDELLHRQKLTCGTLLHHLHALGRGVDLSRGAANWVITKGAQFVDAPPTVTTGAPDQATLWGLGRVISLEHPEWWGGLLDLDPDLTDARAMADAIWPELSAPPGEEQIAYRGGQRYVARLVAAQPTSTSPWSIDPDGAYLISGGLGGLGLQTARWLAAQGARHLILLGRQGVRTQEQQALLAELQAQAVTVKVAQVDVADEAGMTNLFQGLAQGAQRLRGVIHAAGVTGYSALAALTWADFAAMLRPKLLGGWLLHRLSQGLDLDFFVSYASGAGIWGGKAQGHYGAANHFLDSLMAYRRTLGLPGLSIAWGPWSGGGMATPEGQAILAAMGVRSFTPQQGLAIQAYLLKSTASQITAADIDWSRFKPLYALTKPRHFLAEAPAVPGVAEATLGADHDGVAQLVQELTALPVGRRLERLRTYLQQAVGRVLGMTELPDPTIGFTDLGMDSLMALEVRTRLERDLQRPLPTTIAFEYPTVDALAPYLLADVLALAEPQSAPTAPPTQRLSTGMDEPIAVISMACRFPGADTPEAFWQLLAAGADLVSEIPRTRWHVDEFYSPQRPAPGKMYTRSAAFIDQVDQFDPLFFGIAPREAKGMDPHHRLLMEISWELLERAGIAPSTLVDSQTGVFVGISGSDYTAMSDHQDLTNIDTYTVTSTGNSAAAGRLAYILGLQGPTLAVDTACSSSLVSLHLACQSLRTGECYLALAGGVSLILSPLVHIALSQIQSLAADGRCKTFDAAADGYGRGEGSGLVLLKRLSDAQRDGDQVLAVIKGSAVNHDGLSSGFTVPNKHAQEKLIRQALANAQVTPAEVSYVEAHGTGTSLGDPIEIRALGAVFGAAREQPLLVGSVKTNLGHLEQAAGIAGFIKTVLALQHGQIPPHLHFNTPNPYIEWDEVAIEVPTALQPWPAAATADAAQLVAGVSAFGISGTNAHLIVAQGDKVTRWQGDKVTLVLSEAEGRETRYAAVGQERPRQLLTLSAKTPGALADLAARYRAHLQAQPDLDLGDLCYTAMVGRNHFQRRLAIVAADREDLQAKLAIITTGESAAHHAGICQGTAPANRPHIAFLFTGQGAQYLGMGRGLYETQPIFRTIIERCEVVAQAVLGRSLIELLYPATTPDHNDLIDSHPCGQAVNFALECALVDLWQSWGIQPDLVLGHSLGDFAAAYAAGVLSLEDGLRLVSTRGRLMEQAVGSMVSVMGGEAEVAPFVEPYADVVIGVINGPRSVVISGGHEHVGAATAALDAAGFKTRKVAVPMAAHSPLLDPVLDEFETFIREQITLHPPQRPVVSSMTGKLVTTELTDPVYWRQHLRQPVRFVDGVETLAAEGCTIFIEIGPKPTLLGMVEPILEGMTGGQDDKMTRGQGHERVLSTREDKITDQPKDHRVIVSSGPPVILLPSLRQQEDDWQQLLTSLGELYVHGVAIDWVGFVGNARGARKILLPTYPFQHERYWIEPAKPKRHADALSPLIDKMIKSPSLKATLFETALSTERLPFLHDHRLFGTIVAPGACHLAMVLSAAALAFPPPHGKQGRAGAWRYQLLDVILPQPLTLADDETRTAQIIFRPTPNNGADEQVDFELLSLAGESVLTGDDPEPMIHATGKVGVADPAHCAHLPAGNLALAELQARYSERLPIPAVGAAEPGDEPDATMYVGPTFQWLDAAWQPPQPAPADGALPAALVRLRRPESLTTLAGYVLHPGLLNSCFQATALAQAAAQPDELQMPFAVESLQLYGADAVPGAASTDETWWCHVEQIAALKWNLRLFDEQGGVVATIQGFGVRAASAAALQSSRLRTDWLYALDWSAQPLATAAASAQPDCWLIFGTPAGLGATLATALTASSSTPVPTTILVQSGDAFSFPAGQNGVGKVQQATVDPSDPAGFRHLLAALDTAAGSVPQTLGVVYLWGADLTPTADVAAQTLQLTGALLHLSQALLDHTVTTQLWVVTQGCQVLPQAAMTVALTAAAQGAVWGLGRAISQELPQLQTVLVDLGDDNVATQVELLRSELLAGFGAVVPNAAATMGVIPVTPQFAYRSGVRYGAQLQPWQAPPLLDHTPSVVRPDATYLITGGLGALGLETARQLVNNGAKYLVLSGRSGVTTDEQRTILAELTAAGVELAVIQADIAEPTEVNALIAACQRLAPLRGVFHAAGLVEDSIIPAQNLGRLAHVLRPKVDGTWHLHTATQGLDLDYFVCFSSISALFGSAGQSNYIAANAFMDTLMQLRYQQGLPGLSINWGPWSEIGGMAARLQERLESQGISLQERMRAQGIAMIPPQQGRLLFQYLLQQPVAQVGVVALQRARRTPVADPPKAVNLRAVLAALTPAERVRRLDEYVRSVAAAVLGLRDSEAIDADTRLFDFGLDSLMAVELKNKLAAGLDCTLRSTLLFDYPTLTQLIPHLLYDVLHFTDDSSDASSYNSGVPTAAAAAELAQIEAVQELSEADLLSLLNAEIEDIL